MNRECSLPQFDETLCTRCGLCVEACPCHAVTLGEHGPIFSCPETCPGTDICDENFSGCNICEEVCPTGAITCAFEIVIAPDQEENELPNE